MIGNISVLDKGHWAGELLTADGNGRNLGSNEMTLPNNSFVITRLHAFVKPL